MNKLQSFNFKLTLNQKKEDDKLKKQSTCPHDKYTIRCAHCSAVLGSEVFHKIEIAHKNEIVI